MPGDPDDRIVDPAPGAAGSEDRVIAGLLLGALWMGTTVVPGPERAPVRPGPQEAVGARGVGFAAIAPDTVTADTVTRADSTDLRDRAEDAQARYERRRLTHLPQTWARSGECDEIVGRMCMTHEEGGWRPGAEPEGVMELRDELLDELRAVAEGIPRDPWVLGQRVRYLTEAGRWDDALALLERCGTDRPGWCDALRGYALHGAGRYRESQRAFERALADLDPEEAREWRDPSVVVEDDVRDRLEDAQDEESVGPSGTAGSSLDSAAERRPSGAGPGTRGTARRDPPALSRPALERRLWTLADPLWMVEGNDRWTEHLARWTAAALREDARNTYALSWGSDLQELLVRFGWEIGWERTRPSAGELVSRRVVGHHHPDARTLIPPADVLMDPASALVDRWVVAHPVPPAAHAPAYAPEMEALEHQVAVFRRADSIVVVAGYRLAPLDPEVVEERKDDVVPAAFPRSPISGGARSALFLAEVDPAGDVRPGPPAALGADSAGSFLARRKAGPYVLGLEVLLPQSRRGGRVRRGVDAEPIPPDLPAVSDLLLLRGGEPLPTRVEETPPRVLPAWKVRADEPVALAWEVAGPPATRPVVDVELEVRRTDRGVLRRAGEWLGLLDSEAGLRLTWTEAAAEEPHPFFRATDVDLSALEPGEYEVRLRLRLPGRAEMESTAELEILP